VHCVIAYRQVRRESLTFNCAFEVAGGLVATKRALIDHAVPDNSAQPMVKHVIELGGRRLTLADLPLPDTKRWVIRRKAAVVAAVRDGLLSLEEAGDRYAMSSDEMTSARVSASVPTTT
jgi:hypothetical protein